MKTIKLLLFSLMEFSTYSCSGYLGRLHFKDQTKGRIGGEFRSPKNFYSSIGKEVDMGVDANE